MAGNDPIWPLLFSRTHLARQIPGEETCCHWDPGRSHPHVHAVTLGVDDFLKRWLTHVLPQGFVRVRHHGWLGGAARKTRLLVRALVCGQLDEPKPVLPDPPVPRCPHCGAEMKLSATTLPRGPPILSP